MSALNLAIAQTIHTVTTLYIWIIIISALLSFVRPDPGNPLVQAIYRLTEPLFIWVRRKMPFLVISGMDLSPVLIIIALQFLDIFITGLLVG
jgi:YggT family protein